MGGSIIPSLDLKRRMVATAQESQSQIHNHYELLGLRPFETDAQLIESRVRETLRELRKYQVGPRAAFAERQMELVSAATACLSDPLRKRQYDDSLRVAYGFPPVSVATSYDSGNSDRSVDRQPAGNTTFGSKLFLLGAIASGLVACYLLFWRR